MLIVETISKIRRLAHVQGKTIKAICRELGVSRKVVRKVLRSEETEYRDLSIPIAYEPADELLWSCHVKFLWPERPGARRYSGETGRNFPCIESFEAMVANCVCGSATRWNRETIAGR